MTVPHVLILLPEGRSDAVRGAHASLIRRLDERGWSSATFVARQTPSVDKSESNRPFETLLPGDAHKIYKVLHRRTALVLDWGDAHVLINPQSGPRRRNVLQVAEFVANKAFWMKLRPDIDFDAVLTDGEQWCKDSTCDGERDARTLPMHVFAPAQPNDLATAEGRELFAGQFGKPAHLCDHAGRYWQNAKALHGGDQLTVAGAQLRSGFHWDVQSRSTKLLWNSMEVWKMEKAGYLNVYPDAEIRTGQSSAPGVKRIFRVEAPVPVRARNKRAPRPVRKKLDRR